MDEDRRQLLIGFEAARLEVKKLQAQLNAANRTIRRLRKEKRERWEAELARRRAQREKLAELRRRP